MNWLYYPYFYFATAAFWLIVFILLLLNPKIQEKVVLTAITALGIALLASFIAFLWIKLERPPLRTLGETRLLYAVFLPIIGLILYIRWNYKWFLQYCLALAFLFLTINYFDTETHEKTLLPALQSIWFVPHVVVYILAYALLAATSIIALKGLYLLKVNKFDPHIISLADNLLYLGFGFLTLGLLFGALWAKEAWGDYWTWDSKESWALVTWIGYLVYIHIRVQSPKNYQTAVWVLAMAFIVLLICWFGINYLPTAQNSVHTYTG